MTNSAGVPNRTTQTVALVREQGGPVHIVEDYPLPTPGDNEVLAKLLYTGVCQSGMYLFNRTAVYVATLLTTERPSYC